MTLPWETPGAAAGRPSYDTVALAEAAITAAGYVRDRNRHIWVQGNKTAKVMRDDAKQKDKFFVQWG